MKFCPKCNVKLDDNYQFCNHFGASLEEKLNKNFCPYCGEKVNAGSEFCPFCGQNLLSPNLSSKNTDSSFDSNLKKFNSIYELESLNEKSLSTNYLFTYDGRRGRISYVLVCSFWVFVSLILNLLIIPFNSAFLSLIISLLLVCFNFFNLSKRVHDLNKPTSLAVFLTVFPLFSGVIAILFTFDLVRKFDFHSSIVFGCMIIYALFCLINFIAYIYLVLKRGSKGPNRYGEEPVCILLDG